MRDYKIRTALRSGTLRREGLFATAPTLLSGRLRAALHPERRADPGDNYKGHSRNVKNEKARPSGLALKMVGLPGVEPGTNGLCVPLQFSLPLSGLWSGLSLTFRLARTVSTPSLISQGLARDYHAKAEASPNLSDSTKEQS